MEKFKCEKCGQEHEEWPAIAFKAPTSYDVLSEHDKKEMAELDDDFCIVRHSEQTDRFIRCTLTQEVTDHCEDLEYGLWVSLSEKSFQDYTDNFNNNDHEAIYFGWLSNDLPEYTIDESIPMNVYTRKGNHRPKVIPHQSFEHPFISDYYNGITKAEAQKRINNVL
jgi:hypothetical protein